MRIEENSFIDYNTDGTYIMYRTRMLIAQKFTILIISGGLAWLKENVLPADLATEWAGRASKTYGHIHIPHPLPVSASSFITTVTTSSAVNLKYDPIRVKAEGVYELFQDQTDPTLHRIKRTVITGSLLEIDFYDEVCPTPADVTTLWSGRAGYTYINLMEL
jgi:hypothetical protein